MVLGVVQIWPQSNLQKYFEGKPIEIFNKGNHFRDFTFVDDIVDGMFKIIKKEKRVAK